MSSRQIGQRQSVSVPRLPLENTTVGIDSISSGLAPAERRHARIVIQSTDIGDEMEDGFSQRLQWDLKGAQ